MLSDSLLEIAQQNRNKFLGISTYSKIRRLTNSIFHDFGIKVSILRKNDVEPGEYFIGGYYQDGSVVVEFIVSKDSDYIELNEKTVDGFLFTLCQTICHELIHYVQDLSRGDNACGMKHKKFYKGKEQQYLSDPDEIQAYAHDIAMELKKHYPSKEFESLLKISKLRKVWSMRYYSKTFGKDINKIKPKLLKHVYKWLTLEK